MNFIIGVICGSILSTIFMSLFNARSYARGFKDAQYTMRNSFSVKNKQ